MDLAFGYVCFYPPTETLGLFVRTLQEVFDAQSPLVGQAFSHRGSVRFRKKNISCEALSAYIAEHHPDGINGIKAYGPWSAVFRSEFSGKMHLVLAPSPLDAVWAPVPKMLPKGVSHKLTSSLRGLASFEGNANFGDNQHPNVLYVLVENNPLHMHPEGLHELGVRIACAFDGVARWAAVLNASPHINRMPVDLMLIANPESNARMDRFFYSPYLTTLGPKATIGSYASDIKSRSPDVALMETIVGDSIVVSLEKWEDRDKIYMPQWHERPAF